MAIPTTFSRPISSSPSFCFLKPNVVCQNNAATSYNYQRLVVSCCAAEERPSSDPLNLRSHIPCFAILLFVSCICFREDCLNVCIVYVFLVFLEIVPVNYMVFLELNFMTI